MRLLEFEGSPGVDSLGFRALRLFGFKGFLHQDLIAHQVRATLNEPGLWTD